MANMSFLSSFMSTLLLVNLLLSTTTATSDDIITDIEGNPLEVGSEYYIQSAGIGFTGGFRLKHRPYQSQNPFSCPLFVYRSHIEVDPGMPVIFRPSNQTQTTITSSTGTLISFAAVGMPCPQTWSLTEDSGIMYVSTGVYVGQNKKVQSTQLNVPFMIKPVPNQSNIYFISYSPEMGFAFGGLTLFGEDGTNWLGVTFNGHPFPLALFFVKKEYNSRFESM